MSARFPNTSPRAVVAPRRPLALLAAALSAGALAGGLAACGSAGRPSARSIVNEAFAPQAPIHSGRLELSFALSPVSPAGPPAPRWPFAAHLSGAFQSLGAGRLPQFAMRLSVTAAPGHTLDAGAVSTGGRLFVELGGTPFATSQSTSQALARGYAEAARPGAQAAARSTFAPLGIEPARWLTHPALSGPAGEEAAHVIAGLDAQRFFADVDRLLAAGGSVLGAIGAGSPVGSAPGPLAQAAPSALATSVRSARVDLYSGAGHQLRRLTVSAVLSSTGPAGGALAGARQATVALVLAFSELNRAQSIPAPRAPLPYPDLLPAAERLGLLARSLG